MPGLMIQDAPHTPHPSSRTYCPDLILDLVLPPDEANYVKNGKVSRTWSLVVEAVRHTSPSILEPALALLSQYVEKSEQAPVEAYPVTLVPVLFAPYLTSTVMERCSEVGGKLPGCRR